MIALVCLLLAGCTDTTVQYTASWTASEGADSYRWSAGSNSSLWTRSGSGLTTLETAFTAPRSSSSDDSYFCVEAVNEAGTSEQRCTGFTVPAASDTSTSVDTAVASVTVSPASATVEEGGTVQLSATATNASGDTLDAPFAWSSTNTSVASVDAASGTVTGQVEGTAGIVAEADNGVADTATVDVTAASSGGSGPAVVFDPDRYGSTQELKDDPYGVFSSTELGGNYSLDSSVGYPGGSKSMRYDWVDQDCQSISIGRSIPIPGRGAETGTSQMVQEVWIEVYLRWSTNFQQNVDPECAADAPAHKLLFVSNRKTDDPTPSNHGRWHIVWNSGGGAIGIEAPFDISSGQMCGKAPAEECLTDVDGHQYFDGNWHKVRIHLRHDPGLYEAWVDGNLIIRETGFDVDTSVNKMWNLLVGRNKDEGNPSGTESLWWGKLSLWTTDPGW